MRFINQFKIPQQVLGQDDENKSGDGEEKEKLCLQIFEEGHCRSSQQQPRLQCIRQGNFLFLIMYIYVLMNNQQVILIHPLCIV